MKKIIVALITLVVFASCQEQQKIAFIDNSKVINDYQMKIDIEEKFKGKDEIFKKRMDSVGKAFQTEAQKLSVDAQKMSRTKQEEIYNELGQKQQMLQQQFQYEQQLMQQEFNTEIDSVISKVRTFVEDYGKDNGYTYILGKNEAGSVMYGSDANDISETITKALNDAYGKKDAEASTSEEAKEE